MDRTTATLVDGLGAAAASSGILTSAQAQIFALLYMEGRPLALDEIATELQQSKSNVSINVRVLAEWHLVRRRPVPGSRKDHYEAANDFFRAMQAILERRFRWTVRQVLSAVDETRAAAPSPGRSREAKEEARERDRRLAALGNFFGMLDAGIGAFARGEPFPAQDLQNVVPLRPRPPR